MDHYYTGSQFGEEWFSFERLYSEMVRRYPGGTFVELGSWKGRSTAFLGVEIINAKTNGRINARVYAVDVWGSTGITTNVIQNAPEPVSENDDTLYCQFLENIAPVSSVVTPMRMQTTTAASHFADASLDFVFVDADHGYVGARRDIQTWLPKIRSGGVLAGHDYYPIKRMRDDGVRIKINSINTVARAVRHVFHTTREQERLWRDPWGCGCFIATIIDGTPQPFVDSK